MTESDHVGQPPENEGESDLLERLAETEKNFLHGRSMKAIDDWITEPLTFSTWDPEDTEKMCRERQKLMIARLFPFDKIPVKILPEAVREKFNSAVKKDEPLPPFVILNPHSPHAGTIQFEEFVDDASIKFFNGKVDKKTGTAYLEACSLDEWTAQSNIRNDFENDHRLVTFSGSSDGLTS